MVTNVNPKAIHIIYIGRLFTTFLCQSKPKKDYIASSRKKIDSIAIINRNLPKYTVNSS